MNDCVLFVGLGNPGKQYDNNRHNIGFKVIDAIADSRSISFKRISSVADVGMFSLENRKIILAKPLTFMNLSGKAVKFLTDFYKINSKYVYVFHDDIDLDFAKIKIKKAGGNGGHNGLKSIDAEIGSGYWRIRIGVGRPEHKSMVASYVLHDFNKEQAHVMSKICSKISDNIPILFEDAKKFEINLNSVYLSMAEAGNNYV